MRLEIRWKINTLRWKLLRHPFRVLVKRHVQWNFLLILLICAKCIQPRVSRKSICISQVTTTISYNLVHLCLIVRVLLIWIRSPVLIAISSRYVLQWWKLLMLFKSWAIPWEWIRWRLTRNIWKKLSTLSHFILMVLIFWI